MERFADQVCVVTGGGSGIGAAICRALAAEGGRGAVVELREEAGRAMAEECGGRAYACDVADPIAVRETFARLAQRRDPGLSPRRRRRRAPIMAFVERLPS